jgi:hypothetical protein
MTKLNACHNRKPFRDTLRVQDGWADSSLSRLPVMKEVPFRNSRECIYSTDPLVGSKDPGCEGCRWKQSAP